MTSRVTGFGALNADWEATHIRYPDQALTPGAAYDPDPSLPDDGLGHPGAKYVAVNHSHGRVLGYTLNYPSGTHIASALSEAAHELPSDAKILWQKPKDSCYFIQYVSASVGNALGSDNPRGGVYVSLLAANPGETFTRSTAVTQAIFFDLFYRTPGDAGPC